MLGYYIPRPINNIHWTNNNIAITTELVSHLIIFDKPIIKFSIIKHDFFFALNYNAIRKRVFFLDGRIFFNTPLRIIK